MFPPAPKKKHSNNKLEESRRRPETPQIPRFHGVTEVTRWPSASLWSQAFWIQSPFLFCYENLEPFLYRNTHLFYQMEFPKYPTPVPLKVLYFAPWKLTYTAFKTGRIWKAKMKQLSPLSEGSKLPSCFID